MTSDRLWTILEGIQSHIRAFDSKAQIIIGIDGGIAGFLTNQLLKSGEAWKQSNTCISGVLCIELQSAALFATVVSLGFAVFTIHPRLRLNQPHSRTFFAHIAEEFGNDYANAAKTFVGMTDDDLDEDIAAQILANSKICARKATLFKYTLFLAAAAIVLWIGSLPFCFHVLANLK